MRFAPLLAAAALVALAPAVASAQTVVPVSRFNGVELRGGGTINIRQAAVQRVTLVEGNPADTGFDVDGKGRLVIRSCRGSCWGPHHLRIDIETPDLNAIAIMGGGHIVATGAFPAQPAVSVAIHGGGDIDMRDVPAQAATVAINGGGKIVVTAQNSLQAAINGGGLIRYAGHPAVNSTVHGGGAVSPIQ